VFLSPVAIGLAAVMHLPVVSNSRCAIAAMAWTANPEIWTTAEEGAIRTRCLATGLWPRHLPMPVQPDPWLTVRFVPLAPARVGSSMGHAQQGGEPL
jgi:hypothetical protein